MVKFDSLSCNYRYLLSKLEENAKQVLKRLSDICKQHKYQIDSMFVSYTLPRSQNCIHNWNMYSFYTDNDRINTYM